MTQLALSIPTTEEIPAWVFRAHDRTVEAEVDGHRWKGTGHVILRVSGRAAAQDDCVSVLLRGLCAEKELTPGPPKIGACYHFADRKGPGARVKHYELSMGHGIVMAARYFALVEYLYPGVTWWGFEPLGALIAKLNGEMVAVCMPVRPD